MTNPHPDWDAEDTDIDARAIMRQIQERVRRQRLEAEADGKQSDARFDPPRIPEQGARFSDGVYRDLQKMHTIYDKISVGLLLSGSPVPLIAPLVQRIRSMLHRLVIYYVNRLGATQTDFNQCVVRALTALLGELEEDATSSRVDALERQVVYLRAEVEHLRARRECESE